MDPATIPVFLFLSHNPVIPAPAWRYPMRKLLLALLILPASAPAVLMNAQEEVRHDPQAVLVAAQSIAAMGGSVPTTSVATGAIQLVEGSLEETGTVRILTRGLRDSREELRTPTGFRGRVYARGVAADLSDSGTKQGSLELAATSQTPNFPLPLLAAALQDADVAFEYVGQEEMDGSLTHHIRFWNTYPELKQLAEASVRDLWIDALTGLPRKVAYDQREASGSAPTVHIEAHYSDYRNVGGVLYPFLIERIYNGTPWATIRIENVVLNTGLSDAEFAVK